jgi:hypothetical protein
MKTYDLKEYDVLNGNIQHKEEYYEDIKNLTQGELYND